MKNAKHILQSIILLTLLLLVACSSPFTRKQSQRPELRIDDELLPGLGMNNDSLVNLLPEPPIKAADVTGQVLDLDDPGKKQVDDLLKGDAQALTATRGGEPKTDALPTSPALTREIDDETELSESIPIKQRVPSRAVKRREPKLETIYFEYNSQALSTEMRVRLDGNAAFLKSNPGLQVLIEGHTDERGTTEYNYNLGEQRANQVREYLIRRGANPAKLFLVSYGEDLPLDDQSTEVAWSKNRRVEFYVY